MDKRRLLADLIRLGVRRGGALLIHASLRALGKIEGGAETVVQALLEALGEGGTLLMPALSYASVGPAHPRFDVRATPSCVGALPEFFRLRPGTRRSVHPTHSVCAVGAGAVELLRDHHRDTTPVGPCSPFSRLARVEGQILMLGCGLEPNTSMHGVEELIEPPPPYLFREPCAHPITLEDGSEITMTVRQHDFRGWKQRYDRVEPLLTQGELRQGGVLSARCHLIDTAALRRNAVEALRGDPLFFVERVS